ncbi:hypothetical protein [Boudabousia marimammalium]|uniref:EcsC family protein n=1 Tax=Boudabousia marimammalium TaxID=156892 RepID=A0A1Q5PLY2_9ACTO|nr:hypothetical protein [Boudabousia marimammalium]OKL48046.1 hypothetical protein BM477_06145 [Boudabousia marimammalium]
MKIPSALLKSIGVTLTNALASNSEEAMLEAIDAALKAPAPLIIKRVQKLRRKYPDASSDELVEIVADLFISRASWTGGATGAAAFMPGAGTAVAVGVSTAQLAAFLVHSAYMVLTVAEIKGVEVSSQQQRRFMLLAALLGEGGAEMAREELGKVGSLWAKATLERITGTSGSTINRMLAKFATKQMTKNTGKQLVGRALPFGVGAAVGFFGTRSMARDVVAGTYASLDMVHLEPQAFVMDQVHDASFQPESLPRGR